MLPHHLTLVRSIIKTADKSYVFFKIDTLPFFPGGTGWFRFGAYNVKFTSHWRLCPEPGESPEGSRWPRLFVDARHYVMRSGDISPEMREELRVAGFVPEDVFRKETEELLAVWRL